MAAIELPKPDYSRMAFHAWADHHFYEELKYPLRRSDHDPDGYFHTRVNDAWQAWKVAAEWTERENARLRKLLDDLSRITIQTPILLEPDKVADAESR